MDKDKFIGKPNILLVVLTLIRDLLEHYAVAKSFLGCRVNTFIDLLL